MYRCGILKPCLYIIKKWRNFFFFFEWRDWTRVLIGSFSHVSPLNWVFIVQSLSLDFIQRHQKLMNLQMVSSAISISVDMLQSAARRGEKNGRWIHIRYNTTVASMSSWRDNHLGSRMIWKNSDWIESIFIIRNYQNSSHWFAFLVRGIETSSQSAEYLYNGRS